MVTVAGQRFRVSDIKRASCVGSEGELPFAAPRGRSAIYYDMVSASGGFAGLEVADDGRRCYRGDYVLFDELGLSNMRPVEGWREPLASPESGADPGRHRP